MEPDAGQQESQESAQDAEEEDEDEADPAVLAKKQKQLAKRGVTFEAKVDPKVRACSCTKQRVICQRLMALCEKTATMLLINTLIFLSGQVKWHLYQTT